MGSADCEPTLVPCRIPPPALLCVNFGPGLPRLGPFLGLPLTAPRDAPKKHNAACAEYDRSAAPVDTGPPQLPSGDMSAQGVSRFTRSGTAGRAVDRCQRSMPTATLRAVNSAHFSNSVVNLSLWHKAVVGIVTSFDGLVGWEETRPLQKWSRASRAWKLREPARDRAPERVLDKIEEFGFTTQVQHLLGCCGDGTMLWPAQP